MFGFESSSIEPVAAASRLGAALLCGGLIGFDRELHDRPAGFRTHMLVALASALFAILTFEIFADLKESGDTAGADPVRLVSALTSGVAFLAAGTIIVAGGHVRGLTTGAGLWLAGAAGLGAGLGLYWLAYMATGLALGVLVLMQIAKAAVAGARDRLTESGHDERASAKDADAETAQSRTSPPQIP